MKDETLRTIFENSHGVGINMNDTFYYACADVSSIDTDELSDLEPVIEKYGFQAFVAFEAIRRGHDPQIPKYANDPEFLEAKKMILEMMEKADEYGEFFELRHAVKELKAHIPQKRKRISKFIMGLKSFYSFFTSR